MNKIGSNERPLCITDVAVSVKGAGRRFKKGVTPWHQRCRSRPSKTWTK